MGSREKSKRRKDVPTPLLRNFALKRSGDIEEMSEEDIGSREGCFIFIRWEILFQDDFMLMAMSQ